MTAWDSGDIAVGSGAGRSEDKKAEQATRRATLRQLGIHKLSPYGSPMMDGTAHSKKSGSGKGRWRDSPRQIARRNGLSRYWGGRVCGSNHESPRYVSTSQCVECQRNWSARQKETG